MALMFDLALFMTTIFEVMVYNIAPSYPSLCSKK